MKKLILLLGIISITLPLYAQRADVIINRLYSVSLVNGQAYNNLHYLCKRIGGRLAGSPQAAAAVAWAAQTMRALDLDSVWLQPVTVPHWVRGAPEEAYIQSSALPQGSLSVPVCALGGSVATPDEGITAPVIEVKTLDELKRLGKRVRHKIVFFNRPMNPAFYSTFNAYGDADDQRFNGPQLAGELGAAAVIVRSLTVNHDDIPHTGSMRHTDIPAAAISTNAADKLSELLKRDRHLQFYLKMSCYTLPDVQSYNVIGEIKGSQYPHDIIVVGGHLDSWDQAEGANDDGAGCVQSIEVLRLFKTLGIKPLHTIRVILFMNEEFGLDGGNAYLAYAKTAKEKQYAAIESDAGGATPLGFDIDSNQTMVNKIATLAYPMHAYNIYAFKKSGAGADVYQLKKLGALTMELAPDSQRYFDVHHTKNDVFEFMNERELELGAATMASMVYLLDNMK